MVKRWQDFAIFGAGLLIAVLAWFAGSSESPVDRISVTPDEFKNLRLRGHVIGHSNDGPSAVVFSDFECRHCARLHTDIRDIVESNPGEFAVVFRHYPLSGHAHAYGAAVAAECAGDQGVFAEFSATAFEHRESLGRVTWTMLAAASGVADTTAFKTCRTRDDVRARILADVNAARDLGITGTPLLVIGGRIVRGAIGRDSLLALLYQDTASARR